jgi:hypothetical protein
MTRGDVRDHLRRRSLWSLCGSSPDSRRAARLRGLGNSNVACPRALQGFTPF